MNASLRFLLPLVLLALLVPTISAQTFNDASASAQADLDDALERLASLRRQIREERIPLARELNSLESEVSTQRREVERAQRIRDSQSLDLNSLEAEVRKRQDELDYLESLLGEYARVFESRVAVSELPLYAEVLQEAHRTLDDPSLLESERLAGLGVVIEAGLERTDVQLGGASYSGSAVLPDGLLVEGRFVQAGPLVYFKADAGHAGLVETSASLQPALAALQGAEAQRVSDLVENGRGSATVDVTLGDALAVAATRDTLAEHIRKGGVWIYPILLFALIATVVAIFKAIEIFGFREPKADIIHELLELIIDGHAAKALEKAEAIPGPFGAMLADAVRYHADDKELLEEVLFEHMLRLQPKLERMLPLIAVTAATSPLLGLLGTVTGMINTFNLITVFGTGDARSLSSGISEALITTEFGLIVAIPALVIHALLQRRATGILASMEKMAVAFQNGLPRRNNTSV